MSAGRGDRGEGLTLEPLDASRARDFHAVLERGGAESRKCLCSAPYVEYWKDPSLARPCREALFADGRTDGFLLYRDGAPVGWCQVAPRDTMPLLLRGRDLPPEPGVWAIQCLVVVPEARGQGLSHELFGRVLNELRRRGVRRVQAFAYRYAPDEDTSTFVEMPESLCRKAGMALEHDHPMRPVYGLALTPA